MPAHEQTWRDSKLLHVIFGVSSLAMLVTTIWMLAADHRREWKDYQRTFQRLETWTTQARIDQLQSEQYRHERQESFDAWEATRRVVPDEALRNRFENAVRADARARKEAEPNFRAIDDAYEALTKADKEKRPAIRDQFLQAMNRFVTDARFREDKLASDKKFRAAEFDVVRSEYDLGVGNELPKSELTERQHRVDAVKEELASATADLQDATAQRKRLESLLTTITAEEVLTRKRFDEQESKLAQLKKALYEREDHVGKDLLEMPILDAFGRPLKIEQIWLPKLTINYNFRDVARFDRCTTCHQGIDKTAPGSAVAPGYQTLEKIALTMQTPGELPEAIAKARAEQKELSPQDELEAIYGLQLASAGLLDADDATVSVLRADGMAAKAQLEVGDVIDGINGTKIFGNKGAYRFLVDNYTSGSVKWGQPIQLTVRRGVPSPYSSHPRLDLFVGSLSPHKMQDVGCTICHEGQGSATAFKWASHTPNDPLEAAKWKQQYGWFDNHHWIFPMTPARFSESTCLKCHHDLTELEPSQRFPDPPAPKLMAGVHLIQHYGCYGCHEINGFDGPNRRVGPDLRTEPNYSAAAQALLAGGGLSEPQHDWAARLVNDPSNDAARHSLSEALKSAASLPGQPDVTKRLVNLLDDVEAPGKLRKVGPSLRHVASKVGFDFLYSWIRQPSDFRPTTKMPQFFGQMDHLDGFGLKESQKYEPIEIRGATEYLLAKSQSFKYAPSPKDVKVKASVERGKLAFQVRCLACHQQADFPEGKMSQGPDLSRLGSKLAGRNNPNGPKWLYSWLRNPSNYHPRTLMPNMILDPVAGADGKLTDPAADIAEFLLSAQGWEPTGVPERELSKDEKQSLYDLAMEHLKAVVPKRQAEIYLTKGIPEDRRGEFKGDEVELIGKDLNEEQMLAKQLQYVGRRTISKYGCSGCHDIPGFEDAKPIGTGLADWARKTPDKLAFEQIVEYVKYGHGKPGALVPVNVPQKDVTDKQIEEADEVEYGSHEPLNVMNLDPNTGYFVEKLLGHQREGFVWQKLREPRSYDYKKTQNKSYNERLRMPRFTAFDDVQREQVITFVLGLVAEPPALQYVYQGTPRRQAITQGLAIVEKFNCTGCHAFELDRWELAYQPDAFADPPAIVDYAFLEPHFSPQQVKASLDTDIRGLRHATITGMPLVNEQGQPMRIDEEGSPLEAEDTQTKGFVPFVPWQNVLLNGQARQAGLQNLLVPESSIVKRYPPLGGFLARTAFPVVVQEEKKVNPNAKADEAWGWLPPPLVGEGRKVQTAWLHDFLLDPHAIRPAVVLRMPKFNMSPAEASKLVNFFAAVDGVDYPYDFDPRTRESYLAAADAEHPDRFTDAMKIITDNNFCVKCHLLGDFSPTGSERAKAPHLDEAYKRLRPDFVQAWVANPKRILPYTGMPVNIPPDKPVSQALYQGDSQQQLSALVDLLLNYDRFMESKTSIKPLIKPAAPAAAINNEPDAVAQDAAR